MRNFDLSEVRVERFRGYLNKLYFSGNLQLDQLNSFRQILDEIVTMLEKLKSATILGFIPSGVRKDMNRLNSEFILMEYNLSLISTSGLRAT